MRSNYLAFIQPHSVLGSAYTCWGKMLVLENQGIVAHVERDSGQGNNPIASSFLIWGFLQPSGQSFSWLHGVKWTLHPLVTSFLSVSLRYILLTVSLAFDLCPKEHSLLLLKQFSFTTKTLVELKSGASPMLSAWHLWDSSCSDLWWQGKCTRTWRGTCTDQGLSLTAFFWERSHACAHQSEDVDVK